MKISTPRLFSFLCALALAGCGGGSLSIDEGQLRLLNATSSRDFASLDLYAANNAVVTNVPPYTVSGYGDLKHDTYTIDLRQAGGSALVSTTTTLARKEHQTIVASLSGGTLGMTVLSDDEGSPSSGNAKLRIFNTAGTDSGAVDVYLLASACTTLATSAAAPTFSGITGQPSAYAQVTATGTAQHLCVTAAGDKSDLRLDLPSFTLTDKRIVTIVLARGAGGLLLQGIVVDQQGNATTSLNTLARVRVAASVVPAAAIDVDVNGTAIAAGLASPAVGPYQVVDAGPLVVKVNGATITSSPPFSAAAGSDITLLVTGTGSTVTQIDDDNSVSSNSARPVKLRLVNGLNGATGTATLTVNNALVGTGAGFGSASGYATIASSAALARVEARSGTVQYYLANNVTFASGSIYTLFLLGDVADAPNAGQLVADR